MSLSDQIAPYVEQIKIAYPDAILNETIFCGETTLEVESKLIREILAFIKEGKERGYEVLMDLTAVDYLLPEPATHIVYLLHNPTTYARLRVFVRVKREGSTPSVCELWEGANWYEREIYDLFGIKFTGHPDLRRILLPDEWKGHPLQRDHALTEVPVEFKHNAKPKIPSKVIPDVAPTRS